MQHPRRLHNGRALGYLDHAARYNADVETLRSGCAALGLTLVGVIRDSDDPAAAGDGPLADDVDCVAVTHVDEHTDLTGVLAGLPVVILGPVSEGCDA